MPWFPDFAGALELARRQVRTAGQTDPVGQYLTAPSEAPEALASDRVVHQGLARASHGRDWSSRTRPLMIEANPTAWTQSTGTGRNMTS